MKPIIFHSFLFVLLSALTACSGYVPVPWRDALEGEKSLAAFGRRMVAVLESEVKKNRIKLNPNLADSRDRDSKLASATPLRIVVVAFPEARTGLRTEFSRKIEGAIREALERSGTFHIVDGGDGLSWQETGLSVASVTPTTGWTGVFGRLDEEVALRKAEGESPQSIRINLNKQLDDDHPVRGLWPKVKNGAYGESSAVYAASMLGADAAVFGAYSLGTHRIRVWGAVVMNSPPETIYFRRGFEHIFGLPEREVKSRPYLALARGNQPRKNVPDAWLSAWLSPRPHIHPRYPDGWADLAFEVAMEQIDLAGRRTQLIGGEVVGSKDLLVGRIGVPAPRYIYGFAVDNRGETEEVFSSGNGPGKPALVVPEKVSHFSARLLPAGRTYRVYFVSSWKDFDGKKSVEITMRRLGLLGGRGSAASNFREVSKGLPKKSWFLPPGQERLILEEGWDHYVYWVHRKNSK